jgi:heme-degrading monooxygenase HmoA
MFARVTTFEGPPEQVEAAMAIFRDEVIPWLKDATGFRGWIVLVDRERERTMGLTFWATEEAMKDEDTSGAVLRDDLAASVGIEMKSLEFFEVVAVEALALEENA